MIIFYPRRRAQAVPVKMTAFVFQITKMINTIAFAGRDILVSIAREVNK